MSGPNVQGLFMRGLHEYVLAWYVHYQPVPELDWAYKQNKAADNFFYKKTTNFDKLFLMTQYYSP